MSIDYYHFDVLTSTNSFVKENISLFSKKNLSVVTASRQTKGRGRRERHWISQEGNLFLTLVFFTQEKALGSFGIQLAIACCELLKPCEPNIKWPNDILIKGKKIAGILGETIIDSDGTWIVLGIGVNLNAKVEEDNAISLYEITGSFTSLDSFTRQLAESFHPNLHLLEFYSIHKRGDLLKMKTDLETIEGIFLGFGPQGQIRIEVQGKERSFYSGEIV